MMLILGNIALIKAVKDNKFNPIDKVAIVLFSYQIVRILESPYRAKKVSNNGFDSFF